MDAGFRFGESLWREKRTAAHYSDFFLAASMAACTGSMIQWYRLWIALRSMPRMVTKTCMMVCGLVLGWGFAAFIMQASCQ